MLDLVSELRAAAPPGRHVGDYMVRAADEIERLRKWNADMVSIAAHGGVLAGYRETGEKLAAIEAERDALRQELDGVR